MAHMRVNHFLMGGTMLVHKVSYIVTADVGLADTRR